MFTVQKVISAFVQSGHTVDQYQDLYVIDGIHYLNIRHKAEASYHRKSKQREFGMPKAHWDRYVTLATEGKRVSLIAIEEKSNTVYHARLADLLPIARVYQGDAVDKGGTVFTPKSAYKVLVKGE